MTDFVEIVRLDGRRCIRLYGFETRSADLRPEHWAFLRQWVRQNYNDRQHYDIIGMASRLRFRESSDPELNTDLSRRRAEAVEFAILSIIMEEMRRRGAEGLLMPNLDVSLRGVGTSLSEDAGSDVNDPHHRAVILVPGRIVHQGTEIRVSPPIPSMAAANEFWIKYMGGASVSLIVPDGTMGTFLIRDPNGYSQMYAYTGIGGGVSAPISFGDRLPPGEGWVRFTTPFSYLVNSFGGPALVAGGGIQVGGGLSFMALEFASGRGRYGRALDLLIPTGAGFTLGVGADLVGALFRAGEVEHRRWQYR